MKSTVLLDYIEDVDGGQLSVFENTGRQFPSKRIGLPRNPRSPKKSAFPTIPISEIALIHQLFYGYSIECSNYLDFLIAQIKAASVISYSTGRHEMWMLVLDLFKAPKAPIIDLDENCFCIIQNWSTLIRCVITGSFCIFQKMVLPLKLEIYGKVIDFASGHIDNLLIILQTLNIAQNEGYSDKLTSVIDSLNATINRLIHVATDIYLSISRTESPDVIDADIYRNKNLAIFQRVIYALDVEQIFELLKRLLTLIVPSPVPHSYKTCSNSILWEMYTEVFGVLKADSSNWSKYHSICLELLPQSFCSCISSRLLWSQLYLPVHGGDLNILLQLVRKHFKDYQKNGISLECTEAWVPETSLLHWLGDSDDDCLKILAITESTLYVFDDQHQSVIFNNLLELYSKPPNDMIQDELLKLFKRKMRLKSVFHEALSKILIPYFADTFINPTLRISFFDFLATAIRNVDLKFSSELINVSLNEFLTLLKLALTDVSVFVSPSADIQYHGICDLLEWYSKIVDFDLFEASIKTKLQSDCISLATVAIDALEFASGNVSMIERLTLLITLSTRCLDDKSSLETLNDKIAYNERKSNAVTTLILATNLSSKIY